MPSPTSSFESLRIWQQARTLAREIYAMTALPAVKRDRSLVSQLRRASVSILSNIAEGFEHGTRREFRRVLGMAKASAGEVRAQLYVIEDVHAVPAARALRGDAAQLSRGIAALMRFIDDGNDDRNESASAADPDSEEGGRVQEWNDRAAATAFSILTFLFPRFSFLSTESRFPA
jgi:four helix bundle protein